MTWHLMAVAAVALMLPGMWRKMTQGNRREAARRAWRAEEWR